MAVDSTGFELSFIAGADLSAKKFTFVKLHTTAGQVVNAGAGERAIGVLQNDPVSGRAAAVRRMGRSKVVAGGAITAGDPVMADVAGEAVVATGTNFLLGFAVTAADDGDIFECLLTDGSAHFALV